VIKMSNKKQLLLLIIILLSIMSLSVSCGSNEETAGTDNKAASNFFLDIGYENCLICHGSGDANRDNNFSIHCLNFDPVGFIRITDINYSPSLKDCLICHTSHLEKGRRTIYECGRCHYG
jgi:hypothetical protein